MQSVACRESDCWEGGGGVKGLSRVTQCVWGGGSCPAAAGACMLHQTVCDTAPSSNHTIHAQELVADGQGPQPPQDQLLSCDPGAGRRTPTLGCAGKFPLPRAYDWCALRCAAPRRAPAGGPVRGGDGEEGPRDGHDCAALPQDGEL
eukprot:366562-Chlamydomonas_euryale.AAC.15